ncbi:uncharacterized protein [Miscanthus floridulus]|uniref:uncharacterized protein n=1 Tax=Miscanthus floridulus TaxID=154761 RepID=UPI0034591213
MLGLNEAQLPAAAQLLLPPSPSPGVAHPPSFLLPPARLLLPPPHSGARSSQRCRLGLRELPSTRARASSGELLSRRLPPASARRSPPQAPSVASAEAEAYTEPELVLLEALLGVLGRGRAVAPRQLQEVESAVQALEALGGVPDPRSSSLIEGSWQLIFTTRPGTASPIQRTFVGVDSFMQSKKESGNTFTVSMKEGAIQVGGLQFPLDPRPPTELRPRPLCSFCQRRCLFRPAEQPANEFSRALCLIGVALFFAKFL